MLTKNEDRTLVDKSTMNHGYNMLNIKIKRLLFLKDLVEMTKSEATGNFLTVSQASRSRFVISALDIKSLVCVYVHVMCFYVHIVWMCWCTYQEGRT